MLFVYVLTFFERPDGDAFTIFDQSVRCLVILHGLFHLHFHMGKALHCV